MTPDAPIRLLQGDTLRSLTGLRFVAALIVFGTHSFQRIADGHVETALGLIFAQGYTGVSFFFVLSGFILVWSRRDADTPRAFYRRRIARIVPAYVLALVLSVGWSVAVAPLRAGKILIYSVPSFLAVQSWIPIEGFYFGGNLPGWSLSDEAFFYLLFPALFLLMGTTRRRRVVAAVAVAMIIVFPIVLNPAVGQSLEYWVLYVLPVQRLAEFCLGMALAIAMRAGWRFPIPLWVAAVVASAAYLVTPHVSHAVGIVLVTALPFVLLIGAVAQADIDGRWSILAKPVMVRLGEWSYAFYLFHFLVLNVVFTSFSGIFGDLKDASVFVGLAAMLVALAASIVVSAVVYRYYERPLERRIRMAGPARTVAAPDS